MYKFLLLQADTALEVVETTEGVTEVNVLELLMTGGWYIMLPLAFMSLIAMYVIVEEVSLLLSIKAGLRKMHTLKKEKMTT